MAWCQIRWEAITWINDGLVYWRIQTSLGLDELIQYWLDYNQTTEERLDFGNLD